MLINFFGTSQELNQYSTLSKHFDLKGYLKANNRSLDIEGIITEKKEYHPLNIAFFGLLAYDNFKYNQDSLSYKHFINQYKYFNNPLMVHQFNDNREMGLPYLFKFHDLNAPWYSGMTQGAGISYLLRYYEMTKDITALKKAEMLAKFMLKEVKDGGTIDKTAEGYYTIEEYPNTKTSPQVLNGFITGLIGLKEYLYFFPNDTIAKRIHDSCYEGFYASLEHYDTPDWTNYNRKNRAISNMYIRFQLTELEHMYEIYHDERLIKQMMIWGMMAYNKHDKSIQFYKYPNFQYSIGMVDSLIDGKKCFVPKEFTSTAKKWNILDEQSTQQVWNKKNPLFINIKKEFTSIQIKVDSSSLHRKFKIKLMNFEKNDYNYSIDSNSIHIKFNSKESPKSILISNNSSPKKTIILDSIFAIHKTVYDSPIFAYLIIPEIFESKKDKQYKLSFNQLNTEGRTIFYRTASKKELINKSKWIHYRILDENHLFSATDNEFVQFMISYPLNDRKSYISDIKFESLEN